MHHLFETAFIGNMEVKNRLVRSATVEGMCDNDCPGPELHKLYGRLAAGGVGMIITGLAFVSRNGASTINGMPVIDRNEIIPRWQDLVQDYMKDGLCEEEGIAMAEMMAEMGFDGIEVSCGCMDNGNSPTRGELPFDVFVNESLSINITSPIWRSFIKPGLKKYIRSSYGTFPFTQAYNRTAAGKIKQRLKEKNLGTAVLVVGGEHRTRNHGKDH